MVHQKKWYVVITGTEPGVYSTWIEAAPKTRNIPGGSIFQSFPTEVEAIRAFEAAKARGDVKAYQDTGKKVKSTGKSKKVPVLLSPLGEGASLLRTPLDVKLEEDVESTAFRTPFSSPARLPISKLKRTLTDPGVVDSGSTVFSSPPTHTTWVNPPLVYDGPRGGPGAQLSPHFTLTSSSSRAYPSISDGFLLTGRMGVDEIPVQLDVSDWDSDSPPSTPLTSESRSGAEDHTPKPPRCTPLRSNSPSKNKGVKYRGLTGLADQAIGDPRIWLPKARVFDPDKVKPRPWTRPPSPVKGEASPLLASHETVGGSPQLRWQGSPADSPFVRFGRGRHWKHTPSASLPILPDRKLEHTCLSCGSSLGDRAGKRKEQDLYSVPDEHLTELSTESLVSPGSDSKSHTQLVPRDGEDQRNAAELHCPNCSHRICTRSHPGEPSGPNGLRYVDACVSPITMIPSHIQDTSSPAKTRSQGRDIDGDCQFALAGFTQVSYRGVAAEADVRSPIAKGTMIPMNAAESGRMRWRNASRARRLAHLTGLLALCDLAYFSVVLTVTVLTHGFWALQNTVWATVSFSTGF